MTVIEKEDFVAVIDRKIQNQPKSLEVKKKGVSNLMEIISLRSLEDCKLVQTGRKRFESLDGRKGEEKEENQEEGRKL